MVQTPHNLYLAMISFNQPHKSIIVNILNLEHLNKSSIVSVNVFKGKEDAIDFLC